MLFTQLVGTTVLGVINSTTAGRTVRVYAFCTRTDGPLNYSPGSITIVAININNSTASFSLNIEGATIGERDDFLLTAPNGLMSSTTILLNGVPLELQAGGVLPAFVPATATGALVQLGPLSYGFSVLKDANAAACL